MVCRGEAVVKGSPRVHWRRSTEMRGEPRAEDHMISSVRRGSRSRLLLALVLAALLVPSVAHAQRPASALPAAPADSVGMSLARLARLTAVFGKEIEDKKVPRRGHADRSKGQARLREALQASVIPRAPTDAARRDFPHLLDDQADGLGGRDDPGRGRRAPAHGSGLQVAPGVQGREGLDHGRRRCRAAHR